MPKLSDVRLRISADQYTRKSGNIIVRRSFFYTFGRTPEDFVKEVLAAYPTARVISSGEVWKPFRGGAGVAQQSHWFVEFYVED